MCFRVSDVGIEWAALCRAEEAQGPNFSLPCLSGDNHVKIAPCLGCHSGWMRLKRALCILLRFGVTGRITPILSAIPNCPNERGLIVIMGTAAHPCYKGLYPGAIVCTRNASSLPIQVYWNAKEASSRSNAGQKEPTVGQIHRQYSLNDCRRISGWYYELTRF